MHIGASLRFFVYNLSSMFNTALNNHVEKVAKSTLGVDRWLHVASNNKGYSHFENMRSHGADPLIYERLISTVPRTHNPKEADYFVLPFFGGLDTLVAWGHGLQRMNPTEHREIVGWTGWAHKNLQNLRAISKIDFG